MAQSRQEVGEQRSGEEVQHDRRKVAAIGVNYKLL